MTAHILMQAIQIDAQGCCHPVSVRVRGKSITCNRHQIHLHHIAENLAILSSKRPEELQSESVEISSFVMPPPLNAYIYPLPMYIMKGKIEPSIITPRAPSFANEANAVFETLTIEDFHRIYTELGTRALRSNESDAVYDVPAHPLTIAVEDALDDNSSDDDADDNGNSEEEDSDQMDDDEDWEIDEDDIAPPG